MTARAIATMKANFLKRDRQDFMDDLLDTIINPQDAVTLGGEAGVQGHLTIANTKDILPATIGGSDLGSTAAEWGSVYLGDSKGVYFGADQDQSLVHDGTSGLDLSIADNNAAALDVKQGTTSYITVVTTNNAERVDIGKPLDLQMGIDHSTYVDFWDDFTYQAGFTEASSPWVLNSGSNGAAADPAISAQEGGVLQLAAGSGDGSTAQDGSQFVGATPVQADSGALVFECRLHVNTAITNVSVNAGLTDETTLEEPFSIAAASITSTAGDAACFCYDDGATVKGWYALAVDGNTDDTGNGTCAVAPTAGTYQTLRIEVSEGGGTCTFLINGSVVRTLSGGGVSPDVNLYPTVCICGTGGTAATVDVDYIYCGHTR